MSSPGSPLSDVSDAETTSIPDESHLEVDSTRPKKRQKLVRETTPDPLEDGFDTDISEDTIGSVPASPSHAAMGGGGVPDEEALGSDQVSVCKWEGCKVGDVGDMDKLVDHLHNDHIGARQKKYSCEWADCARKGVSHASGYALRAHMRSHTREKPFYCSLPECDRAFTRSDALAKHMRTVHETEALRPSDPVPKHHSSFPAKPFQRVRLVINKGGDGAGSASPFSADKAHLPQVGNGGDGASADNSYDIVYARDEDSTEGYSITFPADIKWTDTEKNLPADKLYEHLRRELVWLQQDDEELRLENERLEKKHRDLWLRKELVLENAMEIEVAKMMGAGFATRGQAQEGIFDRMQEIVGESRKLPLRVPNGKKTSPWWRAKSNEWQANHPTAGLKNGEATAMADD